MKISNKALIGIVGSIVVGVVTFLLHNADCLWALFLILLLMNETDN